MQYHHWTLIDFRWCRKNQRKHLFSNLKKSYLQSGSVISWCTAAAVILLSCCSSKLMYKGIPYVLYITWWLFGSNWNFTIEILFAFWPNVNIKQSTKVFIIIPWWQINWYKQQVTWINWTVESEIEIYELIIDAKTKRCTVTYLSFIVNDAELYNIHHELLSPFSSLWLVVFDERINNVFVNFKDKFRKTKGSGPIDFKCCSHITVDSKSKPHR